MDARREELDLFIGVGGAAGGGEAQRRPKNGWGGGYEVFWTYTIFSSRRSCRANGPM